MNAIEREDSRWCFNCGMYVEPEYVSRSCIAQYGSVVYGKGICPHCERTVAAEKLIDDAGMHPDMGRRR